LRGRCSWETEEAKGERFPENEDGKPLPHFVDKDAITPGAATIVFFLHFADAEGLGDPLETV
jgi:hypothetical protein